MPDGFSDVCMYMYEQIVEVRGRCLVYFCLSPPYFLRASLSLKLELNVARLANLDSSRELSVSSTPDESTGVSFPIGAGTANTAPPACTAISQHQHSAREPLLRLLWEKFINWVAKQQIYFSQFWILESPRSSSSKTTSIPDSWEDHLLFMYSRGRSPWCLSYIYEGKDSLWSDTMLVGSFNLSQLLKGSNSSVATW